VTNPEPDKLATPSEFRKELIAHLSQEVDTHTKMIFDWRARAAFYWLVGPFVLIGSIVILTKHPLLFSRLNWFGWVAVIVACFCFVAMSVLGGVMEKTMWDQCNIWRRMIFRLTTNSAPELQEGEIIVEQRVLHAYVVAHILLLLLFLSSIFLLARLATDTPSGDEGSAAQSAVPASSASQK